VTIILAAALVALATIAVLGSLALRRKNAELDRLRNQRPVSPTRFRHLNVIDRCDRTPGCHATSHEATCFRVRSHECSATIDEEGT